MTSCPCLPSRFASNQVPFDRMVQTLDFTGPTKHRSVSLTTDEVASVLEAKGKAATAGRLLKLDLLAAFWGDGPCQSLQLRLQGWCCSITRD